MAKTLYGIIRQEGSGYRGELYETEKVKVRLHYESIPHLVWTSLPYKNSQDAKIYTKRYCDKNGHKLVWGLPDGY